MPGLAGRRNIADRIENGPLALHHAEVQQVVLERVGAEPEVGAVRSNGKGNSRRLIDSSSHREEASGDAQIAGGRVTLPDGERIERKRFDAIEKLGVSVAIQALGLIRQVHRGGSVSPSAAVDLQTLR